MDSPKSDVISVLVLVSGVAFCELRCAPSPPSVSSVFRVVPFPSLTPSLLPATFLSPGSGSGPQVCTILEQIKTSSLVNKIMKPRRVLYNNICLIGYSWRRPGKRQRRRVCQKVTRISCGFRTNTTWYDVAASKQGWSFELGSLGSFWSWELGAWSLVIE